MTGDRIGARLSRLVVRRRWTLLALWGVVALVFVPQAGRLAERLAGSARVDGSESAAVEALLRGPLASDYARHAVLVVRGLPSPETPAGAIPLHRIGETLRAAPGVTGVLSYLTFPDSLLLGADGQGAVIIVGLVADSVAPDRLLPPLRAATDTLTGALRRDHPGLTVRWTGDAPLNADLRATSSRDVERAERRALPLTALLLVLAFGALVAAALPVAAGALSIAIALGAAAVAASFWSLSLLLQSVVTMLGLGLGIDYALLTVSRFRDALAAHGRAEDAAVEAAVEAARHAGHTILLSASTVALGFLALLLVPVNEVRAVAAGGLIVVIVTALVSSTLLPGILAMLGDRVDRGRLSRRGARRATVERWRRWGRRVTGRPGVALVLGALPLLLLATQGLRLRTGIPSGDWLPPAMESARALHDLEAMERAGLVQAIRVVVELPDGMSIWQPGPWEAVGRYGRTLEGDPRVRRVRSLPALAEESGLSRSMFRALPPALGDRLTRGMAGSGGGLVLVELIPGEDVSAAGAMELVRDLRREGAGPLGIDGSQLRVGGLPAFNVDYRAAVAGRFGWIVAVVLATTVLALLLGFRSVLVPLKAVALNLLSVAAAFGAVVLVFQDGHGAGLLGVDEPLGAVFSSLPVIVFCIVFGLSMDYEIFLMTRVREVRWTGADDREAVVEALGRTGKVITNAAAIMLVVFAAFTVGDVLIAKMLGFALAVAVLLDATLVRMVVGPALLQLAGRWNWWPGKPADPRPRLEAATTGDTAEPDSYRPPSLRQV